MTFFHWLDDTLTSLVLAQAGSVSFGSVGATCHRFRTLVAADGPAWRLLLQHSLTSGVGWLTDGVPPTAVQAPATSVRLRPLALERHGVLFDGGDQLVIVPLPGPNALPSSPPSPPLVLREAWANAQAGCGEVALAIHRTDDLRRGSVAFAPLPSASTRAAKVTRVRCVSTKGANRRSIRFGGTLSALAAGDGLVATARRGSGVVQLWHAESGALVAQVSAHPANATIQTLVLRGALLISGGTDATVALHATRAATASASSAAGGFGAAGATGAVAAAGAEAALDDFKVDADAEPAAEPTMAAEDGGAPRNVPSCPLLSRAVGHRAALMSVELHGGWLLSGGSDGRVLLHATGSPRLRWVLCAAHSSAVVAVVGAGIDRAVGVCEDGLARLWDLRSGTQLRDLHLLAAPAASLSVAARSVLSATGPSASSSASSAALPPAAGAEGSPVPLGEMTTAVAAASAAAAAAAAAMALPTTLVSVVAHAAGLVSLSSQVRCLSSQGDASRSLSSHVFPRLLTCSHCFSRLLTASLSSQGDVLLWSWAAQSGDGGGDTGSSDGSKRASVDEYRRVAGAAAASTVEAGAAEVDAPRHGSAPTARGEDGSAEAMQVELETAAGGSGTSVGLGSGAVAGVLSGFSAARVQQRIEKLAPSVAAGAPEFMAAVLEVVAGQMLQRAGDEAAIEESARIEPHHIRLAVRQDDDLSRLVGEEALAVGGLLRPDEDPAE